VSDWRTKTSIRDGSPSGRFVVDWTEAEEQVAEARAAVLRALDEQRHNPYSDSLDDGERWAGWVEGFDAARNIIRRLEADDEPPALWGEGGPAVGQVITVAGTNMRARWTGTRWELVVAGGFDV